MCFTISSSQWWRGSTFFPVNNDWGNTFLGEYLFSITPERKIRIKTIESLQSLKYLPRNAKCQFFEFQILTCSETRLRQSKHPFNNSECVHSSNLKKFYFFYVLKATSRNWKLNWIYFWSVKIEKPVTCFREMSYWLSVTSELDNHWTLQNSFFF